MNYQELLALTDKLSKYKTEDEDEDKSSFDENDECCICLEKDKLWKASCNHIVCKNCIPQMKKSICPMCRKNILKEINYFFVDRNISIREDDNQRYSDRSYSIYSNLPFAYST